MAMTHDYLDYLNQRVGIAPANSQEELQAAQTIARLMSHHDVEPQIEEFDAPSLAGLSAAILSVLMFVGVLVSGVGVLALTLIGFVLAVIPTVLVALRLFGRAPQLSFGPTARSQNVISVHRATGPLVSKGNRPIVVVAHYDTPRENFLYSTPVAPYLPMVVKASTYCRYVVALCALVQLMGFVPAPARLVLWLLGIVASLPAMLLAVGAIYERVSPCTLGANDNKASVASLLGVMENVRPSGLVPLPREPEQAKDVEEPEGVDEASEKDAEDAADAPVAEGGEAAAEPAEADLTVAAPLDVEDEPVDEWVPAPAEEVVGVRHGEDVLRELQILPEDCEIEYALGGVASLASEPARAVAPAHVRSRESRQNQRGHGQPRQVGGGENFRKRRHWGGNAQSARPLHNRNTPQGAFELGDSHNGTRGRLYRRNSVQGFAKRSNQRSADNKKQRQPRVRQFHTVGDAFCFAYAAARQRSPHRYDNLLDG